jgi:hypothetical protein
MFKVGWARYPKKEPNEDLSMGRIDALMEIFDLGNKLWSQKMSVERAQAVLFDTLLAHDWYLQLLLSIARTKAFFGMKPAKMKEL